MSKNKEQTSREFPKIYEKGIPIFVGVMAVVITSVLIFTLVVALGFF